MDKKEQRYSLVSTPRSTGLVSAQHVVVNDSSDGKGYTNLLDVLNTFDADAEDHYSELEDHEKRISDNSEKIEENIKSIEENTKKIIDHINDHNNPHKITKEQLGLAGVTSGEQIPLSQKGVAGGVATLDENAKVPAAQLPTYVDDILEGHLTDSGDFVLNPGQNGELKESSVIYVDTNTNKTYRWSGTQYTEVAKSLSLGETDSTAFSGMRGKVLEERVNKITEKTDLIPDDPKYTDTTYNPATDTTDGLMSSTDKVKLDTYPDDYADIKKDITNAASNYLPLDGGTMNKNALINFNVDGLDEFAVGGVTESNTSGMYGISIQTTKNTSTKAQSYMFAGIQTEDGISSPYIQLMGEYGNTYPKSPNLAGSLVLGYAGISTLYEVSKERTLINIGPEIIDLMYLKDSKLSNEVTVSPNGIKIREGMDWLTSSDLLHAAGGTTKIKTINKQPLLTETEADLVIDKTFVGLGKVDNTADADKPISTATQSALDGKVDKIQGKQLSSNDYTNAEKNKLGTYPETYTVLKNDISTYVNQNANLANYYKKSELYTKNETDNLIDAVRYTLPTASASVLGGIKVGDNLTITSGILSAVNTTYSNATTTADGLLSKEDKKKLDSITEGANKYVLPVATATTIGGIAVGANLTIDANGILSAKDTVYSEATVTSSGLLSANDKKKLDSVALNANNYSLPVATTTVLGGIKPGANLNITKDGILSAVNTTYSEVTNDTAGLMTPDMKKKLGAIADNANNYVHPTYTAYPSGMYIITVDDKGHVSAAKNMTKQDIVNLGIPAQDTTYKTATSTSDGLMSKTDKALFDAFGSRLAECEKELKGAQDAADELLAAGI